MPAKVMYPANSTKRFLVDSFNFNLVDEERSDMCIIYNNVNNVMMVYVLMCF